MPKVSVVVPVYGVEDYIERCARSLFEQTLDDIEYIFINDCTKDRSIEVLTSILDEYSIRKKQVRIYHNERNLGQVGTRKKGIMYATGEYVIHCDSDDWVDIDWLQSIYEFAKENTADLVRCDYYKNHINNTEEYCSQDFPNDLSSYYVGLVTKGYFGVLWNNLIKKEIAQSDLIVWPEWNYGEDVPLAAQYASMSNKIAYLKKAFYHYRIIPTSISRNKDKRGVIVHGMVESQKALFNFAIQNNVNQVFFKYLNRRKILAKNRVLALYDNNFEAVKAWHECNAEISLIDLFRSGFSIKTIIKMLVCYFYLLPFMPNANKLKENFWSFQNC